MPSTVVWLFPGQGSQHVGMGKALAERYSAAAAALREADGVVPGLRALALEGPAELLDRTDNAQPAILAASVAALRSVEEALGHALPEPLAVAGHSLGEYSAIVAAGALSLADGLRLVRRRGELMHAAAPAGGGMAAVIGLDAGTIEKALEGSGLVIANDNGPGQVVISGPLERFPDANDVLRGAGAKRLIPLRVSAAFHSPAMRAVAPSLATAIGGATWQALRYPVIANVDAEVHEHARELPELLERQVWSPVRWTEIVRRAGDMGARTFVEFGPGSVLTGLVRRILPEAKTANVSDPPTLEAALPLLSA